MPRLPFYQDTKKSIHSKSIVLSIKKSPAKPMIHRKFKTTSELVVCTYPKRVLLPAHPSTGIEIWQRITISGSRYVAAVFFALFILYTRKRVYVLAHTYLVLHTIFIQLLLDIFLDYSFIPSYRINIVSATPKTSRSVLIF